MALIRSIDIGMGVNSRDFVAKMATADKTVGKFAKTATQAAASTERLNFASVTKSLSRISSFANAAGGALATLGAAFALRSAVGQIADIAQSGANLNAILSKTGVIFGDSASIITDEADRVAGSVGGIKTEFVDAATSFGSVFKGLGKSEAEAARLGVSIAKLGMDLASFEGVSNQEAFTALASAIRGENDPIERFRVFLTADKVAAEALASGLAKTKDEIDEYAKKTATLNLILRQTADAQGDLSRTAMDADNQIKAIGGRVTNLRDDLGMVFRPVTEAIAQLANTALTQLEAAIGANRQALADWATAAGASGGAVGAAFDATVGFIGTAADAVQAFNLAIQAGSALFVNLGSVAFDTLSGIGVWVEDSLRKLAGMKPAVRDVSDAFGDSLRTSAAAANADLQKAMDAPWASEAIKSRANAVKAAAAARPASAAAPKVAVPPERTLPKVDKAALATQKKLAAEAKKVFEETRRPTEQYQLAVGKLQKLFDSKLIDQTTFARGKVSAREDAFGKFGEKPLHAGALSAGSAEAYSAQLRFAAMGQEKTDEPAKETAKNTAKTVDLQQQMVTGINKLIEKAGTAAGGAIGELFAI